jgi:hypothetical protein
MPAQKPYSHIYNQGAQNSLIFREQEDYKTFISYLREYLSPPQSKDTLKKEFTINGRTYKGTPHQPKNYYNKVELIVYSLTPDHFHLVLRETTAGSQSRLLRSLCTRYGMYFNKKYARKGSLFDGPYKSANIESLNHLPALARHIYTHDGAKSDLAYEYSSYAEYIGTRSTPWVKPQAILDNVGNFKEYMGGATSDAESNQFLKNITLNTPRLERITAREPDPQSFQGQPLKPKAKRRSIVPEFIFTTAGLYILLFGVGFRNVLAAKTASVATIHPITVVSVPPLNIPTNSETPIPEVAGEQDSTHTETASESADVKELEQIIEESSVDYVKEINGLTITQ